MTAMQMVLNGIFATVTAAAALELHPAESGGVNPEVFKHFGRISHRLAAMRTNAAHESLRAGKNDGRGNQKRRNAHVIESRDGTGRVVAVQGAQDLMSGERGLDRKSV